MRKFAILKICAVVALCSSLAACSGNNKSEGFFGSLGSSVVGKKPIKPVDHALVLGAANSKDLVLAVNKAHDTKQSVRIILTPGTYSIDKPLVLSGNTLLTTFNPTNGGKHGPWLVSDIKSGKFVGPVVIMQPGSAIAGVNIKQLNSYSAVGIRQLPVSISNMHLQTTKDQSLIYIEAPKGEAVNNLLTLKGVTLTNMYLHKTAPSIRIGYSAPMTVKFEDSYINYPKGVLILPKTTRVLATNTVFNTDLSGLSNIKLHASMVEYTKQPKKGIVPSQKLDGKKVEHNTLKHAKSIVADQKLDGKKVEHNAVKHAKSIVADQKLDDKKVVAVKK